MANKLLLLKPRQIIQIVLPLAIIAIFTCVSFSNIMNDIIKANVVSKAEDLSKMLEYEVRLSFEPPALGLTSLVPVLNHDSDDETIKIAISATGSAYPQCSAFYFASTLDYADGGKMIYSTDNRPKKDYRQSTRAWFQGAKEANGALFAGEPYIGASSGKLMVTFSQSVTDDSGDLIGVAACDLNLDTLSTIVQNIHLSQNAKTCIVDMNGMYLTNSDASKIMSANYFDTDELAQKLKLSAFDYLDGSVHSIVKSGKFFAVRKLAETPWFVIIEGPVSDFTGNFKMWLRFILVIVALLILANVAYNSYTMSKTQEREHKASNELLSETQNLVVASKENAATAQDQSAAVKEIVATMEDQNSLSENIAQKIKDVAGVANNTNQNVNDGKQYLEANVAQLNEIAGANQNTIDGIKALGDKIGNIWDIVTLINSVADQAKIIAFNAELEASSAGEAGKNFHIVATEIRRLADGIIDGTKEIKASINEIQQSSDSLILASENGTDKIKVGVENAKNLEERFTNIKNASEITATSANEITTIIQQQAMATEQILITLKQISAGVENFTAATENISKASSNLKNIASELTEQKQRDESKMEEA